MKRRMELNGVANLSMLIECETDKNDDGTISMNLETFNSIKEQLILLERYMLSYNDAVNKGEQTPFWHEVYSNPSKYPRNRDR